MHYPAARCGWNKGDPYSTRYVSDSLVLSSCGGMRRRRLTFRQGPIEYAHGHGGNGGDADSFDLRDGEYITAIGGRYGQYVDSIQFYTNMRISTIYGGSGGDADYYYEAPPGWQIVRFYGRSGDYVDAIGVVLAKL